MSTELNPYSAPKTPSDAITNLSSPSNDDKAYRIGSSFFCKPDFQAPPVCFRSGEKVKPNIRKRILGVDGKFIELYFSPSYLKSVKSKERKTVFSILGRVLLIVFVCGCFLPTAWSIMISLLLFLVTVTLVTRRIGQDSKIKMYTRLDLDEFIEVTGAHPEFLKMFSERTN